MVHEPRPGRSFVPFATRRWGRRAASALFVATVLGTLCGAHEARADRGETVTCGTHAHGAHGAGVERAGAAPALRYCLELPDARRGSPDVLVVYFHGLTGSERDWQTYGPARELERALEKEGLRAAVLSPSFGPFWLLKETRTPSGRPPLLPVVEDLIASTRAKLPAGIPVVAVGVSLGGYNALQFYFKRPDTFRAIVLGAPAVVDASPFGEPAAVAADYVRRSRAWILSTTTLLAVTRGEYLDELDYAAHDPLALAEQALREGSQASTESAPPLFVQVGAEDHFGFQLGSGVLQRLLRLSGRPVEFGLLSGGRASSDHVVLEGRPAARFLARSLGAR